MKYKVTATIVEKHVVEVEAESMDAAKEQARVWLETNDGAQQSRRIKTLFVARIASPGQR